MEISVIIATYNRSQSLKRTLESFKDLLIPEGITWEIIIIDNNSTDNTKKTVEEFMTKTSLNIIYIHENKQGKPFALNRGLMIAKGKIFAFTDDDVIVDRNWLYNIIKAFDTTNATCLGGKVLPSWAKGPPAWLTPELYGCIALLDMGDEYKKITEPVFGGVNMAIKADFFKKSNFTFNTKFLKRGEDTDLLEKLLENNEPVYYCPDMLIYHCIPNERMKKSYFRKWKFDQGKFRAHYTEINSYKNIFGIPLFIIRQLIQKLFNYIWFLIIAPKKAFVQQVHFIHYLGFIVGKLYKN